MQPLDFVKAAGVAALILVVNVLIAILVVLAYSVFVEPGHPREFYDKAALRIAPWCSHTAGTVLFFIAGYVFARWQPQRDGLAFALTFTALYAVLDAATVKFKGVFNLAFALSMLVKLLAGLGGAFLAARRGAGLP